MCKKFFLIVGFVCGLLTCTEGEDKELIGCAELKGREICVYCVEGLVEVDGAPYDSPFVLCSDWCKYTSIAAQITGCEEYL